MKMRSKNVRSNTRHCRQRASGFSLLEMVIVVAISLTLLVVSVVSLEPLLKTQRVTNSYNMTLAALRQARDNAISQRTAYQVTFNQTTTPPVVTTITVAPTTTFTGDLPSATYQYPNDVFFLVPPTGTSAPDSFGTGSNAIDFGYTSSSSAGGQTSFYFCPDGSAQTASTCAGAGNWDGGVVYLARSLTDTGSYRAVDLFGATGRLHGWRLYPAGSGYQWIRQ
jgi:prepilin-type N-terminal cleavage/methylation domain-containing protein